MINDSLGDRMKGFEDCWDIKLPNRMVTVIRVDGKGFHTMTKKWKCTRPYDGALANTMLYTGTYLCKAISGCMLGYQQSDEISFIVRDDQTLNTQAFFDKRVMKVCSVVASMASTAFNDFGYRKTMEYKDKPPSIAVDTCEYPAIFDCRMFCIPENEIVNYLIWRQQDATRNSIQMLAQSKFSHKELQGKSCTKLQDMCYEKDGTNWNNIDTWKKRGVCFIRAKQLKEVDIKGEKKTIERNIWMPDMEIPIFTQDRDYVISKTKVEDDTGIEA